MIPGSLNCERENDYINWVDSPFYVNKSNKNWKKSNGNKLTGAVSSFGMSGTNAHMVVESYNSGEREGSKITAPYYLLALSAKTEAGLKKKVSDMIDGLKSKDLIEDRLTDISYTLLEGRMQFKHRCAIVIRDKEDAVYVWEQYIKGEKTPNRFSGSLSNDFTGQKVIFEYGQDILGKSKSFLEDENQYKERLYALADLYCQGYDLSWERLFEGTNHAGLVSLCTLSRRKNTGRVKLR